MKAYHTPKRCELIMTQNKKNIVFMKYEEYNLDEAKKTLNK